MTKIIAVAGGSGSGKTTFTQKILNEFKKGVSVLSIDSYYRPHSELQYFDEDGRPNFDHPTAFDWDLLKEHLSLLKRGKSIESPCYDFKASDRLKETKIIGPDKVVLFEGIFSLFDEEIRKLSDIKVFLHVEADIRFTRRLHRDVRERGRSLESVIEQYYATVRPMYQKYLDPQRQFADLIVGEETDIAAAIISSRIREIFKDKGPLKQVPVSESKNFDASFFVRN
ncbi:uridine kinase [Bacteriovoracales bacterium]|nr:uridine kinase [Bacteriovoracales bacterium]